VGDERHPLISFQGRATLDDLLESTDAPVWNHLCGDRLDAAGLERVRAFAAQVRTEPPTWREGSDPGWLAAFIERTRSVVPRYRDPLVGVRSERFTTSRDDLVSAWWELVPDDADLDDLIWFPTSGNGHAPVVVPTHPVAVSSYYPLLLEAARWHGVTVTFRPDRADWATVVSQAQGGFTVPSWSSVLGCATAKVNLHDGAWNAIDDRARFLERHDPQVITGDPGSLSHLADLDLRLHPAALVSTALRLARSTRQRLEQRFACPVIDVFSTTESGPIAAALPSGGWGLLQPRLHVEITEADGTPSAPGALGMLTISGGMNPYLPLLRYRTGDTARLRWVGDRPVLDDLVGRAITMLRAASGADVSSFDVTQLLERLPLRRWSLAQASDDAIVVSIEPEGPAAGLELLVVDAVRQVLGAVPTTVQPLTDPDKVQPFVVEARR
jgi:phenylacetate-CoA ligase